MHCFQIFCNPADPSKPAQPPEPYYGFMQQIRDMAESYTLIAPNNFMGPRAHFVPLRDLWAELPERLHAPQHGLYHFDALRARYLATHFDHVYLDIDVELRAPLEIGPFPRFDGPGVLLGNGDAELGLACWEAYLRLCPGFCRPATLMFADCREARNLEDEDKKRYVHHLAHGAYF